MKNLKCAISKGHIQNGRSSRYQDVKKRKKCAKAEQKRRHVRKYRKQKNVREKKKKLAEDQPSRNVVPSPREDTRK